MSIHHGGAGRLRRSFAPAGRLAITLFLAWLLGTALLLLPPARVDPGGAALLESAFTAASALCVTGLTVVDTQFYWTHLGQGVILALIQVGGLGVMLIATLLSFAVSKRVGMSMRLGLQAELHDSGTGGDRGTLGVVRRIIAMTVLIETITGVVLALRFMLAHHMGAGQALWYGFFHSVSAFNNAGFGLRSDNLVPFASDPWILVPISINVIVGGLGFPVLMELLRHWRLPREWHLTTRVVVVVTPLLLVVGTLVFWLLERDNPVTLGPMSTPDALVNAFFHSTIARTAGFNSVDIGALDPATLFALDGLMFIGGGPAGTAGGIKVTTFTVVIAIAVAEILGARAVNLFGRRLARSVHREALTVMTLASLVTMGATFALLILEHDLVIEHGAALDAVVFEAISAFSTVGLSTGITPQLSPTGQVLIMLLMFTGRLGPVTLAAALAVRPRPARYELPRERLFIG